MENINNWEERLRKTGWWPHLETLGERSLEEFLGAIGLFISEAYLQGAKAKEEEILEKMRPYTIKAKESERIADLTLPQFKSILETK